MNDKVKYIEEIKIKKEVELTQSQAMTNPIYSPVQKLMKFKLDKKALKPQDLI